MDKNKDAYGQEVWAYYNGKHKYEIVERDDGYIDCSDTMLPIYFADFKDWPELHKKAIKKARGEVLDVGAGVGRAALYLQKKGIDVTAIDNSPLSIQLCKKRGVKKAKVLPLEKVDTFRAGRFRSVVMLGNNFGLFGGYKKAKRLLKKLYKVTTPDAVIIAESNDPYQTDDPDHLSYHKFNKKRGRMPGQLRIRVRFKRVIGEWFDYLMVSKEEMEDILEGTGWRIREFIDSDRALYVAIIEKKSGEKKE